MPTANVLPNTLGEVVQRCQGLMGDPTGRLISRSYALPFINQAYESMRAKIKNASGKNLEAIIEVLNIPSGTVSLYPYQQPGNPGANPPVQAGPLIGLYDPIKLWCKRAGALPGYYTEATGSRDTLPHVNPPGITPGNYAVRVTWAWIGNKLSMTPVAGNVDIQVYGRFNPPRLVKDEDELLLYPDMTFVLAYAACGLFGIERSNPALLAGYADEATASFDNIVADVIRQSQRNPRRIAKLGGRGGTCWGWV